MTVAYVGPCCVGVDNNNPMSQGGDYEWTHLIMEHLLTNGINPTTVDKNPFGGQYGDLVPELAESWSVRDDHLTWTFNLRQGVKWHDGTDFTADDVAFSLQRVIILDKTPAFILSQLGWTKDNVKDLVKATDKDTVTLTITEDFGPSFVLNTLSAGVGSVVDKKTVLAHEKNGDLGYEWMKTNSAGSGPFILKSWKANESVVLEANPNYRHGAPHVKRLIIRHIPEASAQRLQLEKGDIDIARNLTGDQLAAVKNDPNIKFQSYPKSTLWYMGLNTKNQYLGNKDARQAMKYLVDYDGLQKTQFDGTGIKHQTFLPDGQLGADNETPFSFDVAKAKELLKAGGQPNGFDVTIDVTNKSEARELAASLQSSMAKAGVNLIIRLADNKTTLTKYRASEHDIYLGQWGSDYQDPHSNADGYLNSPLAKRNQWQSPERAAAVTAARDEKDATKRAQMYMDLQKMALDESPYVILFQQVETIALRKNVNGFVVGPSFDLDLYKDVTKE